MSLPTLDQMRTDILTKVAKCARKNEREFKVPDLYKEAARLVATEGKGFRFDGNTFSW